MLHLNWLVHIKAAFTKLLCRDFLTVPVLIVNLLILMCMLGCSLECQSSFSLLMQCQNFISHLSCWFDACVCAFHFTGMQYGEYVNNQASSAPTPLSSTSDDEEEEEEDEEAGLL